MANQQPTILDEFDYSVWTPDTVIELMQVPWDSSYRDLVRFEDSDAKKQWFTAQAAKGTGARLTGLVYLRYGEPVRVPLPFSQCNQFNYLVAHNPQQPVPSRSSTPTRQPDTFYYFVTDVQYLAPNCTLLNVQLDVWQTYYERLTFGRSYVTRGHIAMANSNATIRNLADYLTEPEGLEYGDEYEVVHQEFVPMTPSDAEPWVFIMSNTRLDEDWGNVQAPKLRTAQGSKINGIVGGAACYVVKFTDFLETVMWRLALAPWVSQGIMQITILPSEMVSVDTSDAPVYLANDSSAAGCRLYPLTSYAKSFTIRTITDIWQKFAIPERYYDLLKLYTSPYCIMEVTSLQGAPLICKPECFTVAADGNSVNWRYTYCVCPPETKIVCWPTRYNAGAGDDALAVSVYNGAGRTVNANFDDGEGMDFACQISNFPQLSIVNNMYQNYLASTANTRAFQFSNASWAQQKSLTAANNAYNVAQAGMDTAQRNQDIANQLTMRQTGIGLEQNTWNGIKNIGGSVAGGIGALASGNVSGALSEAANAVLGYADMSFQADWMTRSAANQMSAQNQTLRSNLGYQAYTADTNYSYANFAANGDYQQAIQGINATVRDAALTQPSVSGQLGGSMYNWANGYVGFLFKWKRIKTQYLHQIGDYFMRYGYYVNRFLVPPADLKCMNHFTYWQLQDAVIYGNLPEAFRQALRGIFESGCTVWSNPDEIGRIDYAVNTALSGVSY